MCEVSLLATTVFQCNLKIMGTFVFSEVTFHTSKCVLYGKIPLYIECCFTLHTLHSLHNYITHSPLIQGIFDILAEMYPRPKALVLDWSHNLTLLFNCFAKLLAHPLQRPLQNKMDHKLEN